ncbi:hypothetical protein ACFE04_022452 [Oxalis oulophora]
MDKKNSNCSHNRSEVFEMINRRITGFERKMDLFESKQVILNQGVWYLNQFSECCKEGFDVKLSFKDGLDTKYLKALGNILLNQEATEYEDNSSEVRHYTFSLYFFSSIYVTADEDDFGPETFSEDDKIGQKMANYSDNHVEMLQQSLSVLEEKMEVILFKKDSTNTGIWYILQFIKGFKEMVDPKILEVVTEKLIPEHMERFRQEKSLQGKLSQAGGERIDRPKGSLDAYVDLIEGDNPSWIAQVLDSRDFLDTWRGSLRSSQYLDVGTWGDHFLLCALFSKNKKFNFCDERIPKQTLLISSVEKDIAQVLDSLGSLDTWRGV